jgi:hypothetical protein
VIELQRLQLAYAPGNRCRAWLLILQDTVIRGSQCRIPVFIWRGAQYIQPLVSNRPLHHYHRKCDRHYCPSFGLLSPPKLLPDQLYISGRGESVLCMQPIWIKQSAAAAKLYICILEKQVRILAALPIILKILMILESHLGKIIPSNSL